MDEMKCKVCGCTWNNACIDGRYGTCYWVENSLCSACATPEQLEDYDIQMKKEAEMLMEEIRAHSNLKRDSSGNLRIATQDINDYK